MLQMSDGREDQVTAIKLRKENTKEVYQIVKAISFREHATFHAISTGMRIIIDDQHCQQANVYFSDQFFSLYTRREDVSFRIPVQDFLETLCMFDGNGGTLQMTYDGFGEPLRLTITAEEDDFLVRAKINTVSPEPVLEFDFDPSAVEAKVLMKPDLFRDCIKQLDESSHSVTFDFSPRRMSVISQGDVGKITSTFPSQSELVELFECCSQFSHTYRMLLIKRMSAALHLATKICLRIDSRGVLCIQFLMGESDISYVEFFSMADAESDDL